MYPLRRRAATLCAAPCGRVYAVRRRSDSRLIPALFWFPGPIEAKYGGIVYARQLMKHLPAESVDIQRIPLLRYYPDIAQRELAEIEQQLSSGRPDAVLLIDGFVYGQLPSDLIRRLTRPIVALVHHPLSEEAGLTEERRIALRARERTALCLAHGVIAASPHIGRVLVQDFNVPQERVSIAPGGTARALRARGTNRPVHLISVGAISARKNHVAQIDALRQLKHLNWHLNIVGSLNSRGEADPGHRRHPGRRIARTRETLRSERRRDAGRPLRSVRRLVSTSLYEGYGLALTEALARGLPIVTTTAGAAHHTVPDDAAIKVAAGDTTALRDALEIMITDMPRRRAFAEASWEAGKGLTRWSDTAAEVARAIRAVSPVAGDPRAAVSV